MAGEIVSDGDRELLEMAAKAVGYEVVDWYSERYTTRDGDHLFPWNPLADDGAALRLAVKLRMMVSVFGADVRVDHGGRFFHENGGSSLYAATRRAIVLAAAEIGKSAG